MADRTIISEPDDEAATPRTWGDTARGAFTTVDDAVRAAANTITFGMADRAAGALNRATGLTGAPDYRAAVNEEVAKSSAARERSPYASVAGDVGGVVALPAMGGSALAARLGSGLGARALGYGLEGAGIGAAQGAGSTYTESLPDYVKNAATGGVMGGILGAGLGSAFAPRPAVSRAAIPTVGELEAAKNAEYKALTRNAAEYHPSAIHDLADTAERRLYAEGFGPRYSPATWDTVAMMRSVPGNATVTPGNLDYIRKQLNQIPFTEATRTDRRSGGMLREAIDDFLVNPPSAMVRPGTETAAAEASRLAEAARGNYAAMRRGQKMEAMTTAAEDAAAASHSGLNRENLIRQAVKNFVNPNTAGFKRRTRGFTPDEIDMLRQDLVRRGAVANAGRVVGNWIGGGGGVAAPIVAGIGGGAATNYFGGDTSRGALAGAAIPLAGMAIRGASNRSAANAMERATGAILARSPLYQGRAAGAGIQPGPSPLSGANTATARDALALELLRQQRLSQSEEQP